MKRREGLFVHAPHLRLLLIGLLVTAACDSEDERTYYEDVRPILQGKCSMCHTAGGIGPYRFDTYDEAHQLRAAIKLAVETRTMPPWLADQGCNSYVGDWSLSQDQIDTIVSWTTSAAAEGDASNEPGPVVTATTTSNFTRSDLTLTVPEPYTPTLSPDDYRCFLMDWPLDEVAYVTGVDTLPGNPQIVHHVITYLVPPNDVATFEELDEADPEPGYTCYGGPGSITANMAWLGAWAPGQPGADTPAGTGIRVEPGSKVVLQVHYNVLESNPIPDQSSMRLKIDTEVEREAAIMPFVDVQWVFFGNMPIPAGAPSVDYSYSADLTNVAGMFTNGALPNNIPLEIHGAALHMHEIGKAALLEIRRDDGQEECVLSISDWDFNWQRNYQFVEPIVFNPGDALTLRCNFDNSPENQSNGDEPKDKNWGDGTQDEMCLGILYVSPAAGF